VSAAVIRTTAFKFAKSKATMSLWTMGINQRTQGTALNAMLNALHLLTGQFGRPGATPFSVTGQPNACGGVRDTGALAHLLPNGRKVANEKHRHEVEKLWGVPEGTIPAKPGLDAVSLFRAMESGKVKATLVMCTNPAQSMPAADRYRKAMERRFLVVAEVFGDSETAQVADVLLPAALWVEKEGVLGPTTATPTTAWRVTWRRS
jgi:nitrate reductase NapA